MDSYSEEGFDQYEDSDSQNLSIYDSDSEPGMSEEPKMKAQQISAVNLKYDVLNANDVLNYLQGKAVELSKDFDYAKMPDGYFMEVLRANNFIIENAKRILGTEGGILNDMEKYQRAELKPGEQLVCNIDFLPLEPHEAFDCDCNHFFCQECYQSYLSEKISSGPQSIYTRCPEMECCFPISLDLVSKVCEKKDTEMYKKFLLNDFISKSPNLVPCTRPDCGKTYCTVEKNITSEMKLPQDNAICKCGNINCLRCGQAGHQPLNCEMYKEWMDSLDEMLNKLNNSWKKKFSKKCPECKVDIQKNQGCMHMTCASCRYEFCWLCLGNWKVTLFIILETWIKHRRLL